MKKFFLLMTALMFFSAQVEAAKIDAYQKILESGRYTIRYDNLTPFPRVTNRDLSFTARTVWQSKATIFFSIVL